MKWLLLVVLCAAVAGCGESESGGDVTITVTRDFGSELLHEGVDEETAPAGGTAIGVLEDAYDVEARDGSVQEIDGLASGRVDGRRAGWFSYVNGIEALDERELSGGERVWWDHHVAEAAERIPAVVGSFPEPFANGLEGKRFPVKLVCAGDAERSCDEVTTRLIRAGVDSVSRSVMEQSAGEEVLRVIVGRWTDVRQDAVVRRLERGPGATGVFAQPTSTGDAIVVLDADGRPVRTLRAGAGLVAATGEEGLAPTWIVTGTDEVGLAAAAAALTEERLMQHFALAIERGADVPLPVRTEAGP